MTTHPDIHPVILCGGAGTRLWPLSRRSYPKQFAKLIGQESLFQASARRLRGEGFRPPLVLTADPFRFIVTEQLAAIEQGARAIVLEPECRNTAPAVLAAALWLVKHESPDAVMLVVPSDHAMEDPARFQAAVRAAAPRALAGDLVTFGIAPTGPETGYGYLELATEADMCAASAQPLVRFVEKPEAARALAMLAERRFLWNAGIFLFRVDAILAAYRTHASELLQGVSKALDTATLDLGFTRPDPRHWCALDPISIDYAIMEKAQNLAVMPYGGAWSDLGSWDAVWRESCPDQAGNVVSARATAIECSGSLLRSESSGLELVGIGLEDIVAVAMSDGVIVARRCESQRIKQAVATLKARSARQAESFPLEHRPWGWFESLASGDRFQVKRIVVRQGAALSLQSHRHRAEHWIVVQGAARVTVNDTVSLVSENQSVYIPLGAVHRLENPGPGPMVLIEVQTGAYLGEDDIIRYEDVYARG
jgi:mannose-1-phosphate guanylyltransferase/mannose-6-phosphate isomerase